MAATTLRAGWLASLLPRLLLGGVLFYAGFTKLSDVPKFAEDIEHYKLLPMLFVRAMAIALPWNEVVIGAMLILGIWTRTAALLSIAMFIVFAGAVTQAIVRGYDIKCGCFGHDTMGPLGYQTLAFDGVCLALALVAFVASGPAKSRKAR